MDQIPEEWSKQKLSNLTKSFAGGTPNRSKAEYYNGTIPWIKSGEVNQRYIYDAEEHITSEGLKNSSAKIVKANSVLVAMYGATAGKVALLKTNATTNQAVLSISAENPTQLCNNYLFWVLTSQTDVMLNACQGAAQPNLSKGLIDGLDYTGSHFTRTKKNRPNPVHRRPETGTDRPADHRHPNPEKRLDAKAVFRRRGVAGCQRAVATSYRV